MRKISFKITKEDDGKVKISPADTSELTFEEHTRLENALKELTFLRTYSSRLTIRLAAWEAVESAFEGDRVRIVPDKTNNPDKYSEIAFSTGEEDDQ